MPRFIDLTGKRFGRLTVIKVSGLDKYKKIDWLCSCDCGKETVVSGTSIRRKLTTSCGCYQKEVHKAKVTTHGHSKVGAKSPEYKCWSSMKRRCDSPRLKCYRNYGGRGIVVCDRWINSFENFLSDMGERPSPKHSIDRIKVNGNYEPSNCKWSTDGEQEINKRTNPRNTSGFTGVSWHKQINRWVSVIMKDKKSIFLGSFIEKEEAIAARAQAEIKYWNKLPS